MDHKQELADQVTTLQKYMHGQFRDVPAAGKTVTYLDKDFLVLPGVFWPFEDSKALAKNFVIKPGETVLEVGTGSGVLAILAAYKGAKKIVALDINPLAVVNAKKNAELHGFTQEIDVRLSDVFSALQRTEKFNVIIANLPFRDLPAQDPVEQTTWDTGFKTNKTFFSEVSQYLEEDGRIYIAQSNFGEIEHIQILAKANNLTMKQIGEHTLSQNDPRKFYAFELKRQN